jgi:uncharacterized protein (UPF0218 family)
LQSSPNIVFNEANQSTLHILHTTQKLLRHPNETIFQQTKSFIPRLSITREITIGKLTTNEVIKHHLHTKSAYILHKDLSAALVSRTEKQNTQGINLGKATSN